MPAKAYLDRGVSPTKDDVKRAVAHQARGLYPGAFCKIVADTAGDPAWCTAVHADGAGTKSAVAYMMYRETGDPGWFGGIAQDALVMNTDDLACVGATENYFLSNTIGRNAHRVDGRCVAALIQGYDAAIARMEALGITITMTGGETADVGDLVRTLIADSTIVVRFQRAKVVDAARIQAGNRIVGLASFGQATYEDQINSGIGSNGLTAARHLLLHPEYRQKYPETYSETIPVAQTYAGSYHLDAPLPGEEVSAGAGLTIGEALLSPTRTYVPVVRAILQKHRQAITGMIHCTGGGQVKCRDFGTGLRYIKDQLFPTPAIFAAIRDTGAVPSREMYQIFNMGHRMEVYCDASAVSGICAIAASYGIAAQEIGKVEAASGPDNEVIIDDCGQTHTYT